MSFFFFPSSEQLLWAKKLSAGQSLEASYTQICLPDAHQLPLFTASNTPDSSKKFAETPSGIFCLPDQDSGYPVLLEVWSSVAS